MDPGLFKSLLEPFPRELSGRTFWMWKNLLAAFTAAELQRRGQFKGKDLYIKMHEILLEQLEVFFKIFKKDLGMIPNGLTPETILSRTLPASAKSGSRKKIVSTPADEESMMLKNPVDPETFGKAWWCKYKRCVKSIKKKLLPIYEKSLQTRLARAVRSNLKEVLQQTMLDFGKNKRGQKKWPSSYLVFVYFGPPARSNALLDLSTRDEGSFDIEDDAVARSPENDVSTSSEGCDSSVGLGFFYRTRKNLVEKLYCRVADLLDPGAVIDSLLTETTGSTAVKFPLTDAIMNRFDELELEFAREGTFDNIFFDEHVWVEAFVTGIEKLFASSDKEETRKYIQKMCDEYNIDDWIQRLYTSKAIAESISEWFTSDGTTKFCPNPGDKFLTISHLTEHGFSESEARDICKLLKNREVITLASDHTETEYYSIDSESWRALLEKVTSSYETGSGDPNMSADADSEQDDLPSILTVNTFSPRSMINDQEMRAVFDSSWSNENVLGMKFEALIDAIEQIRSLEEVADSIRQSNSKFLLFYGLNYEILHFGSKRAMRISSQARDYYWTVIHAVSNLDLSDLAAGELLRCDCREWLPRLEMYVAKDNILSALRHTRFTNIEKPFEIENKVNSDWKNYMNSTDRCIFLLDIISTRYGKPYSKLIERKLCAEESKLSLQSLEIANDVLQEIVFGKDFLKVSRLKDLISNNPCEWKKSIAENSCENVGKVEGNLNHDPLALEKLIRDTGENLKNISCLSPNISWEDIRQDIEAIYSKHHDYAAFTESELGNAYLESKDFIADCLNSIDYSDMRQNPIFYGVFGLILAAIKMKGSEKSFPRQFQVLAALMSLQTGSSEGTLLERKTEEGKTMIIVILSLIKAMAGKKVDVITSSRVAAKDVAREASSIFAVFGFSVGENGGEEVEERRQQYEKHVVFGEVGDYKRDYLLSIFHQLNVRGNRDFEIAIVDDGDKMFHQFQSIPGMGHLQDLFVYIWAAVHDDDVQKGTAEDIQEIEARIHRKTKNCRNMLYPEFLEDFVQRRLETWIESAFLAKQMSDQDALENTGVESEDIHQFLQLRRVQVFHSDTSKPVFMPNALFFKKYQRISGLTAALNSHAESAFLSELYNFSVASLAGLQHKRYTREKAIVTNTVEERNQAIVKQCKALKLHRRHVLVINDSVAEVNELVELFKKHKMSVTTYATGGDNFAEQVENSEIILSTSFGGGGRDITISKGIEQRDGLHIILSNVADNFRIEQQAFERAALNGQKVSGQYIVSIPHFASQEVTTSDSLLLDRDLRERLLLIRLRSCKLNKLKLEEDLTMDSSDNCPAQSHKVDSYLDPQRADATSRNQGDDQMILDSFQKINLDNNSHEEAKQLRKFLNNFLSKDPLFRGENDARSASELIAQNPGMKAETDLSDKEQISNAGGLMVGKLKQMYPGAIFYSVGEGDNFRYIMLLPSIFESAQSETSYQEFYRDSSFVLDEVNSTTKDTGGRMKHRVPVVDGVEIELPSLDDGNAPHQQFFCDERTRLFVAKYKELLQSGENLSKEEKINIAKEHASDIKNVYNLRRQFLEGLPDLFNHDWHLRETVASMRDNVVGANYVSTFGYSIGYCATEKKIIKSCGNDYFVEYGEGFNENITKTIMKELEQYVENDQIMVGVAVVQGDDRCQVLLGFSSKFFKTSEPSREAITSVVKNYLGELTKRCKNVKMEYIGDAWKAYSEFNQTNKKGKKEAKYTYFSASRDKYQYLCQKCDDIFYPYCALTNLQHQFGLSKIGTSKNIWVAERQRKKFDYSKVAKSCKSCDDRMKALQATFELPTADSSSF